MKGIFSLERSNKGFIFIIFYFWGNKMVNSWAEQLHSFFTDQMNTLEQVISSVHLSINKMVYCKSLEAEAVLCVSVQLLGQQPHTGLADHTVIWFISSSKDRTCGNCLWDQGFQIAPAVRGHNFSRSHFIFFIPYITKEVTVQEMLKDPFSQSSVGDFVWFQNVHNTTGC